jgi:hypothetical protein
VKVPSTQSFKPENKSKVKIKYAYLWKIFSIRSDVLEK